MSMPESQRQNRRPYFWEKFTKTVPDGRDLAALRAGIGRGAGEVPAMWPYYTALRPNGEVTVRLRAEHAALCLFASHQQSQRTLMHRPGVGLGIAMGVLRADGKFSEEAVDRRFGAAATATSFAELTLHLRGLVTQLRALPKPQPLDYTRLVRDLVNWQDPDEAAATRRIWGSQYFTRRDDRAGEADQIPTAGSTTAA